jgi:hypothetical protein
MIPEDHVSCEFVDMQFSTQRPRLGRDCREDAGVEGQKCTQCRNMIANPDGS